MMGRPKGSRNQTRKLVHRSDYLARYEPMHPLADSTGYVLEHRMLAWDAGVLTDPSMHVHHIDGDKHNNDITNLQAMTEADHHRLHISESAVVENQYGIFPLTKGECIIDGCDQLAATRGWCNGHYIRWRRSGSPFGTASERAS